MSEQIYALDFRHSGKDLQRLGAAPSSDCFHCLSWGTLRSDVYHVSIQSARMGVQRFRLLCFSCISSYAQQQLWISRPECPPYCDIRASWRGLAAHGMEHLEGGMRSRIRLCVLAMQDGVIAAGLASGVIEIWDPAKLAAGKGEAARITKLDKHKGPVSASVQGSSLKRRLQLLQQSCCAWLIWQPSSHACLEWLLCAQV